MPSSVYEGIVMDVEMTYDDREFALEKTYERNRRKREAGVKDQKFDSTRGTLLIDYMGLLGERAVAKTLGIPVQQFNGLEGDEGYDLIWHGLKLQIRYTFHNRGHLIVNCTGNPEQIEPDIYILTIGSESRITILGYATRDHIRAVGTVKNFGYGNRFVLEQRELTDFAKLLKL